MKQLTLTLFCLLLLVACKDNEPAPVTPTPEPEIKQVCYCTEAFHDAWNGKSRSEYLYDTDDKLVRLNYYSPHSNPELSRLDTYHTFEYDNRGNIIIHKLHVVNSGKWAIAMEATYNDNDLITGMTEYHLYEGYPQSNPVNRLTTYQYSPSFQLLNSQTEHKDNKGDITYSISSYSYEYDANDLLTRRYNRLLATDSDYRFYSVFTFDGKAHPLSASPAYLKLFSEYFNAIPVDKKYGNILTAETYNQYKEYDYVDRFDASASYNTTFEYNALGYPTKEIKTYRSGLVETNTYTYNCK